MKVGPMRQFVKLVGVTPEQLVALHQYLKDDGGGNVNVTLFRTEGSQGEFPTESGGYRTALPIIILRKSTYDEKCGTYTVELEMPIVVDYMRSFDDAPGVRIKTRLRLSSAHLLGLYAVMSIFPNEDHEEEVKRL